MRKSEKRVKSSSRRNFLKGVTAISVAGINSHSSSANGMEKESLASAPAASQSQKDKKFIAIQVGAVSFVDEGVDKVLDIFQERARINALMLAVFTYGRGIAGRQVPGQPLPDHGAQEHDTKTFYGGRHPPPPPPSLYHTTLTKPLPPPP